jgi:adenosylcobinamide-phosphate synthase
MGALALTLGVRLGKPGVYALIAQAASPEGPQFAVALARVGRTAWIAAILLSLPELVRVLP